MQARRVQGLVWLISETWGGGWGLNAVSMQTWALQGCTIGAAATMIGSASCGGWLGFYGPRHNLNGEVQWAKRRVSCSLYWRVCLTRVVLEKNLEDPEGRVIVGRSTVLVDSLHMFVEERVCRLNGQVASCSGHRRT